MKPNKIISKLAHKVFELLSKISPEIAVIYCSWKHSKTAIMGWYWNEAKGDFILICQNEKAEELTSDRFETGDGLLEKAPEHLDFNPDFNMPLIERYKSVINKKLSVLDSKIRFFDKSSDGTNTLSGVWRNTSYGNSNMPYHDNVIFMEFDDVTIESIRSEELYQEAYNDYLTGIPNRKSFYEFLEKSLENNKGLIALFFIDLDKFKKINDRYGHLAGDFVLKEFSKRVTKSLIGYDSSLFARLSGDEFGFVVKFADQSKDNATNSINRIRRLIRGATEKAYVFEGKQIEVNCSIGVFMTSQNTEITVDQVIAKADAAMYQAKGSNSPVLSLDGNSTSLSTKKKIDDIKSGISQKEFIPFFQPIRQSSLDYRNSTIIGYECLVRWNHPKLGVISPVHFLPEMNRYDLIFDMTIGLIVHVNQHLIKLSADKYIAINFSPSFSGDQILELAQKIDFPRKVVIEITEDGILTKDSKVAILELKSMGFRIALDDFGVKNSTLYRMVSFPWDIVKIDSIFRTELKIMPGLVEMVHGVNAKVVLEGIEAGNINCLRFFFDVGGDAVQGYLCGKPQATLLEY